MGPVPDSNPSSMLFPMLPVLLVGCVTGVTSSGPLPQYMIGEFELETSEGFNNYMYAVGVDWFTRKIACSLYPTARNAQSDQEVTISTESTFKSTSVTFKLGTPFQENTADGRTVTTTATLSGDELIKTQTGHGSELSSVETRRFLDGGNKMILIHTLPTDNTIKSVRGYKRIN